MSDHTTSAGAPEDFRYSTEAERAAGRARDEALQKLAQQIGPYIRDVAALPVRSSVRISLNAKGDHQWELHVYAGDTGEELEDAVTRALALDQRLSGSFQAGGGA